MNARSVVAQGMGQGYPLAYEAAIARIALEWALASRYATDVLFDEATAAQLDCLIVVQGLQANALATALATHWSTLACTLAFDALPESGHVQLHRASDAHDEADRASACVLAHLNAGRTPVALAAVDRVLTRRISATLALHGVAVLDETGWKLSTTRCAAALMALLRAARWDAGEDAFLDWLKHTGVQTGLLNALEHECLALSGLARWAIGSPGRCPGLACPGPLAHPAFSMENWYYTVRLREGRRGK